MPYRRTGLRRFPIGFLLGTATAAHQVEGNNVNSDWWAWEQQPGTIKDGTQSGIAVDHYNRYADDLKALAAAGHTTYRFSIEWARVEPQPGVYDQAALAHYADVVATCRRVGLEPVVTLHHFTLPQWMADRGSLHARDIAPRFGAYANVCAETFGKDVKWWITLNEPTILASLAYQRGEWPPAKREGYPGYLRALASMVRMHGAGAQAIRQVAAANGYQAMVSVAHHERPVRPSDPASAADRQVARLPHYLSNRLFLRACMEGRLWPPLGFGQPVAGTQLDFLGVNYYVEGLAKFDIRKPGQFFARDVENSNLPKNTYGWPIDAGGLSRALVGLHREFGLPMMVTENGVSDVNDELRPQFLIDHLDAVLDAIDQGADIRGYATWSAWDNFEWKEGYAQKFGLYAVDRTTMQRLSKPSANVFSQICRRHGISATVRAHVRSLSRDAGLDAA